MNLQLKLSEIRKNYPDIVKVEQYDDGDRWYYEEVTTYIISLNESNELRITYEKITEDDDDWGQAEAYLHEYYTLNDLDITRKKCNEILDNIKAYIRDDKINKILK